MLLVSLVLYPFCAGAAVFWVLMRCPGSAVARFALTLAVLAAPPLLAAAGADHVGSFGPVLPFALAFLGCLAAMIVTGSCLAVILFASRSAPDV